MPTSGQRGGKLVDDSSVGCLATQHLIKLFRDLERKVSEILPIRCPIR